MAGNKRFGKKDKQRRHFEGDTFCAFFLIAAFQRAVLQHEQITKRLQVKALRLRQQQVLIFFYLLKCPIMEEKKQKTNLKKNTFGKAEEKYPSFINLKKITNVASPNWSIAF